MIDNVWTGSEKGYFHTATVAGGGTSQMKITSDEAMKAWLADRTSGMLAAGDYDKVADRSLRARSRRDAGTHHAQEDR